MLDKIDDTMADKASTMYAALMRQLNRGGESLIAFDAVAGTAVSYQRGDKTTHNYLYCTHPNHYQCDWMEV